MFYIRRHALCLSWRQWDLVYIKQCLLCNVITHVCLNRRQCELNDSVCIKCTCVWQIAKVFDPVKHDFSGVMDGASSLGQQALFDRSRLSLTSVVEWGSAPPPSSCQLWVLSSSQLARLSTLPLLFYGCGLACGATGGGRISSSFVSQVKDCWLHLHLVLSPIFTLPRWNLNLLHIYYYISIPHPSRVSHAHHSILLSLHTMEYHFILLVPTVTL